MFGAPVCLSYRRPLPDVECPIGTQRQASRLRCTSIGIVEQHEGSDGHVQILAASIRHLDHLLCSFALHAELATAPGKVWEEGATAAFPMPGKDFVYKAVDKNGNRLNPIPYKELDLRGPWESFDIRHELTTKAIQQFVAYYKSTLKQSA
jgi:transaldolase